MESSHTDDPKVLVLGGWSPGPISYLKHRFRQRCIFIEPSIPMPPVGYSWCIDPSAAAIVVVLVITVWALNAVPIRVDNGVAVTFWYVLILPSSVVCLRLCVAGIVRGSIRKGVMVAQEEMRMHDIRVVLGFSWGGSIAAEFLCRDQLLPERLPAMLLLAPTTAVVASIAKKRDPVLLIQLQSSSRKRCTCFMLQMMGFVLLVRDGKELA